MSNGALHCDARSATALDPNRFGRPFEIAILVRAQMAGRAAQYERGYQINLPGGAVRPGWIKRCLHGLQRRPHCRSLGAPANCVMKRVSILSAGFSPIDIEKSIVLPRDRRHPLIAPGVSIIAKHQFQAVSGSKSASFRVVRRDEQIIRCGTGPRSADQCALPQEGKRDLDPVERHASFPQSSLSLWLVRATKGPDPPHSAAFAGALSSRPP
jgi:hypothetical protein